MKIGVILSGCGVYDGAEIQEAVLTLLAISKLGHEAVCLAPDVDQAHVIDHLTGQVTQEKRNVLTESARIARGQVKDLKNVKASEVNALILPGGFGAAKNLSSFAFQGKDCKVNPEVARMIKEVHAAGKPVGAICIAPALLSKVFEGTGMKLTIGNEKEPAEAINAMGNRHVECGVLEIVIDSKNKIVTTPAYMLAQNISEAAAGIEKLIIEVIRMAS
jgi:enhancing lycopene biosynthesis protein 2